jgi:hypothetical protein
MASGFVEISADAQSAGLTCHRLFTRSVKVFSYSASLSIAAGREA